ncbi:MAG TPA: hypothetical protein VL119_01105 [Acidimicrobiia bacterium]|nr:hypothetical protein [Acidimicrobiia bacterium]
MANDRRTSLPHSDERAEIEAAARQTAASASFPSAYLDQVYAERDRFVLRTAPTGDIRAAVALLEEQTNLDASAPLDSRNRGVTAAKQVVRKATFFAINHLAEQTRALGWASAAVGRATAERIEQLEADVRALEARVAALDHHQDLTPEDTTES